MAFALALTACSKDGGLNLSGLLESDTPTPEDTQDKNEPSATPEPTKEAPTATATPVPTAEPTKEPEITEEPTEAPTPEVTEEPTPEVTAEPMYPGEDVDYDKPEPLVMGVSSNSKSEWNDGQKLYEVSYDSLVIGNAEREKYPNLALMIDILDLDSNDQIEEAVNLFKEYVDGGNILTDYYYFARCDYDIIRADSYVISVVGATSSYTGGMHPDYGTGGYSIDTETGDILQINDVCNDPDSLGTMIAYKLEEKYGIWEEDGQMEELISYIDGAVADGSIYFTIGHEGVTFYFVPYEIATYADGNLQVTIPFEESFVAQTEDGPKMVGLFKKKYCTVPDNYMMSITLGENVEFMDIDGETGSFGTFTLCGIPNEKWDNAFDGFYMLINGQEVYRAEEVYFDGPKAYIAVVGERRFLILVTNQASDDTYTYMFEIKDGEIIGDHSFDKCSGMDMEYLRTYYGDGKWDYRITSETIYDPMNIRCSFRFDVIGTNFVTGTFKIDTENLTFEPVSRYYDFGSNHTLTLKKDFKAGMIDPELMFNDDENVTGEMDMEVELKAGDTIKLEKTTADHQVFFSAENGEWGTFKMDEPENIDPDGYYYSHSINGEDIDDLFDGISYAD